MAANAKSDPNSPLYDPAYDPKNAASFANKSPDGNALLPEYQGGGSGNSSAIGGAELPTTNPLAKSMYDQQLKGAQDYAAKMPALSDTLYNNAATTARAGLTQTLRGTRNNYNSRGLLNSGGERGAEAGARSKTESDLANTRSSINQGLVSNLQGMEGNAFGSAAGLAQPGVNVAQPYLSGVQSNIAQQQSDAALQGQMYGQASQGIGQYLGQGLAGAMYQQQQQNPYYGVIQPTGYGSVGSGGNYYQGY